MDRGGRRRVPSTRPLRGLALAAVGLALAGAVPAAAADDALARGDAAWARRALGHDDEGRACPEFVGEAIDAYAAAAEAAPEALAPRWKLVRALYFAADFADADPARTLDHLRRATREADAALALLGRELGADPETLPAAALRAAVPPGDVRDAAGTFFWSAVAWGSWSQRQGALDAFRTGVATRLYRLALAAEALDPDVEGGGAHRLLARIHAQVPRIPFVSGFVDPGRAVPEAERALAIAPWQPENRYLLALTILDVAPERRSDALRLLEQAASAAPRPDEVVEDLAVRRAARERLSTLEGAAAELARGGAGG